MKILWICNVPNKMASEYKREVPSVYGGWLTGMSQALGKTEGISLVYCYPLLGGKKQDDFEYEGVHYFSFYIPHKWGILKMDADRENVIERKQIKRIINEEKPDIIHLFGTEYVHSLIASEEAGNIQVVCSIQGLTSICAMHYLSYIPHKLYHKINFASIFRNTLWGQKNSLKKRGIREIEIIKNCNYIIGRTDWDKVCTYYINPSRKYYVCNETLRDSFYVNSWDIDKCAPFSIFVSQGSSPLKGFNMVLEILNLLKDEFPLVKLRVAGTDFTNKKNLINRIKISVYGSYIRSIIKKYSLEDKIEFLGNLNEKEMVQEYQRCNVFLSASSIENSSNSVCEAMILGVPIVSSNVGGINSLMQNKIEGILYQGDAPYMAAAGIREIFLDKTLAQEYGKNARKKALDVHNISKNNSRLINIYRTIVEDINKFNDK